MRINNHFGQSRRSRPIFVSLNVPYDRSTRSSCTSYPKKNEIAAWI